MIKLFSSDNRFLMSQLKDQLDAIGIPCFIKNEFAAGAMGELAPQDCYPEIWLYDEEWLTRAKKEVAALQTEVNELEDWVCQQCDEGNEASFQLCWQCQTLREAVD
ncbi:DUF2007 domain-containing protein [Alteromonadaceae bacterium BrNp21-10]|nr:DUF2007 domain-containing protein [Alteromonadaceae bacterium BrNp21-10]